MANVYDFLGAYGNDFMKSSAKVFTDLSDDLQYVGKTEPETVVSPNTELIEWKDNTGGTQTLFQLAIDSFDLQVGFAFTQIFDPNIIAIALNTDMDKSAADITRQFMGSDPNQLAEAQWRFVWQSIDNRTLTLVVRRGILVPNGDITTGTPGSFTNVPVTLRALQDTTISDGKRDVAYFEMDNRTFS